MICKRMALKLNWYICSFVYFTRGRGHYMAKKEDYSYEICTHLGSGSDCDKTKFYEFL